MFFSPRSYSRLTLLACLFIELNKNLLSATDIERGCIGSDEVCTTCQCSENNSVVNCTSRRLSKVPDKLPKNLTILNLQYNNITQLNNNTFDKCYFVTHLDLAHNRIVHMPQNLFEDMSFSLQYLHLNHNRLILDETTEVFDHLNGSLKSLFIQYNDNISERIFGNLYELTDLKVDGSITGGFGRSFSQLKSLSSLDIYPNLTSIQEHTFKYLKGCRNLTTLNLADLNIEFIHPKAFEPLTELRSLDLGYNLKLTLIKVSESFDGITNKIEKLDLPYLLGNFWPTLILNDSFYKTIRNKKSLKTLNLNKNGLLHVDGGFHNAIKHVEKLDLSFNRLTTVFGLVTLMFTLVNLTEMNISYQTRRTTADKEEGNPDSYTSHKKLEHFRDSISMNSKKMYSESECKAHPKVHCLFPLEMLGMQSSSWCVPCPKNLKSGFLSELFNEDIDYLPATLFFGDCRVERLELKKNGLTSALGPIMINRPKAVKPMVIDLGFNGMVCLAPDILEYSIKRGLIVGELVLEGNDLSHQLISDTNGKTFALYTNLTSLNLANNKIKNLNRNTFYNLISLKVLNLSANSLQTLKFDLIRLQQLRVLDISSNLFVQFESEQLNTFTSMSRSIGYGNVILILENNPFQCGCDNMKFVSWINSNTTFLHNLDKIDCLYNSERKSITKAKDLLKQLRLECIYETIIYATSGAVSFLIFCILLGFIIHKYKWDIRYFLLKMAQRRKQYLIWREQATRSFEYDAFISYDERDRQWVLKELMPNLEKPSSIKYKKFSSRKNKISNSERVHLDDGLTKFAPCNKSNCDFCDSVNFNAPHTNSDTQLLISCSAGEEFSGADETLGAVDEVSDTVDRFKFCIHERDFEVGMNIEANILSAIERSRKVILVVSKHFVESKWCRFELEMAKMENLERRRNVILTVFLEPVGDYLKSLEYLSKQYTYVEWFKYENPRNRQEFWRRMEIALSDTNY